MATRKITRFPPLCAGPCHWKHTPHTNIYILMHQKIYSWNAIIKLSVNCACCSWYSVVVNSYGARKDARGTIITLKYFRKNKIRPWNDNLQQNSQALLIWININVPSLRALLTSVRDSAWVSWPSAWAGTFFLPSAPRLPFLGCLTGVGWAGGCIVCCCTDCCLACCLACWLPTINPSGDTLHDFKSLKSETSKGVSV